MFTKRYKEMTIGALENDSNMLSFSQFKATLNNCSERFEFASRSAAVRRHSEHRRRKIGPRSNLFSVALTSDTLFALERLTVLSD